MYIYENICFECGEPSTEDHHVIPKSMGGKKTIPLCSDCHSKVHGLGVRRDQHKELTTRALNKKMSFDFYYVWWSYFKCADEDDWKDIPEIASDLGVSEGSVKNRIKRLKSIDPLFLEEMALPFMGYDYKGISVFNTDPYELTDVDIMKIQFNRKMIETNLREELGMTP